jgi:hypothetical protein
VHFNTSPQGSSGSLIARSADTTHSKDHTPDLREHALCSGRQGPFVRAGRPRRAQLPRDRFGHALRMHVLTSALTGGEQMGHGPAGRLVCAAQLRYRAGLLTPCVQHKRESGLDPIWWAREPDAVICFKCVVEESARQAEPAEPRCDSCGLTDGPLYPFAERACSGLVALFDACGACRETVR